MMKKRAALFAIPCVVVVALAFHVATREPENPLLDPSAITWEDIRHDNTTVTGTVEDDMAIIRYSDGSEERIELVEDEQSYTQSGFP